jgi:hypothetical protein
MKYQHTNNVTTRNSTNGIIAQEKTPAITFVNGQEVRWYKGQLVAVNKR